MSEKDCIHLHINYHKFQVEKAAKGKPALEEEAGFKDPIKALQKKKLQHSKWYTLGFLSLSIK